MALTSGCLSDSHKLPHQVSTFTSFCSTPPWSAADPLRPPVQNGSRRWGVGRWALASAPITHAAGRRRGVSKFVCAYLVRYSTCLCAFFLAWGLVCESCGPRPTRGDRSGPAAFGFFVFFFLVTRGGGEAGGRGACA